MDINITQRQATLAVMAVHIVTILVWFILSWIVPDFAVQPFVLIAPLIIMQILYLAYWRGWELAVPAFLVTASIMVGEAIPLPDVKTHMSLIIVMPCIVASVVAGPRAIVGSALLAWAILAARAGFQGGVVGAGLLTLSFCVVCLLLSRLIMESARRTAERNAHHAKSQSDELRLSDERYRALAANLPNSVVILYDHQLRFVLVDGPEADRAGYSREALIGKTLHEAVPATFAHLAEPNMRAALAGKQFTAELPFDDQHYLFSYVPLRNNVNQIIYGMILGQNITSSKHADDALKSSEETAREFQTKLRALHEVTLEASRSRTLDELYVHAVELGVRKVGFERLSLWLLDDNQVLHGTYGWDAAGHMTDERHISTRFADDSREIQLIRSGERARLWPHVPLKTAGKVVGSGWDALALLWDGTKAIGLLSTDNLLSQKPPPVYILDLMSLYGNLVGSLLNQQRAEQALRASEERYRIITELISDYAYYYHVRPDGSLDAAWVTTESFSRLTGYASNRQRDFGSTYQLYHPDDVDRAQQDVQETLHGKPTVNDYRILTKSGELRWVHLHRHPVWSDTEQRVIGLYGAAQDITARKLAETTLQQLNAELEQRVTRRTAQLETVNKELEAFTYSVSHDLRAPLRAIDGFSRTVIQNFSEELPDKAKYYLNRVQINAHRMSDLIDDLLVLSRLGRKELKIESVDMNQIIERALREFSDRGEIGTAAIRIAKLPPCAADSSLIQQVYVNLISNALKYSSKAPHPQIDIDSRVEDNEVVYFVRDNGTGFDMKYADKLFGIFQRLHNETDFEGTGIGLAVVKRIITRHEGRVWAVGEVEQGATVYFTVGRHALPSSSTYQTEEPASK